MLVLAMTAWAGDELPPELILLARFKQRVRQDLIRVPNYTCLETMERAERPASSTRFHTVDTIRLEISTVNGKELLAWPGARQFEDREINSFVTAGAFGTGMFTMLAHDLFVNDTGRFQFEAEENLDGRRTARYEFHLSSLVSGLNLHTGGGRAMVAAKGSFWFDPTSLDLVRVDIYGDEMPAFLRLAGALIRIYYSRAHIGSSEVLLPRQAEMELVHSSGDVHRNTIEFSGCREYATKSTISFEAPKEEGPLSQVPRPIELPAGLVVQLSLETAIDSQTASVGDPVRATVRKDARLKGDLVLPAGAVVSGSIVRLEHHAMPEPRSVLGIELHEVEWENNRAEFSAILTDVGGSGDVQSSGVPGLGILEFRSERFHLGPGFHMRWRTGQAR